MESSGALRQTEERNCSEESLRLGRYDSMSAGDYVGDLQGMGLVVGRKSISGGISGSERNWPVWRVIISQE